VPGDTPARRLSVQWLPVSKWSLNICVVKLSLEHLNIT
jgi:hypothetical protein